jgi:hypothetical protein
MNPLYEMFNQQYIQQQAQQAHHFQQVKQVQDTAKALKDFLDGFDRIEPAYKDAANAELCAIVSQYLNKHMG